MEDCGNVSHDEIRVTGWWRIHSSSTSIKDILEKKAQKNASYPALSMPFDVGPGSKSEIFMPHATSISYTGLYVLEVGRDIVLTATLTLTDAIYGS